MLTIRMQRGGRKGHPQYRVVVQDSRFAPTSGRVVAQVGTYNPHSKEAHLDKEKLVTYLSNGAQPSDRVAMMLSKNGVELPKWVTLPSTNKSRSTKNTGKLRRNTPEEPASEVVAEESTPDAASDELVPETEQSAVGAETSEEA